MSDSATYPVTGSCNCGAVRYEVSRPFIFQAACHCTQCQKHTQSAFSLVGFTEAGSFRVLSGALKKWSKKADSGNAVDCHFCATCGNRIYHVNPDMPDSLRVKLGTLDDTSVIRPEMHVWTQHKQPWYPIPPGAPTHATQPELASLLERTRRT